MDTYQHRLVIETRKLEGKETSPRVGVIDNQSVKTTESGGSRGYDPGKKTKDRKRHHRRYAPPDGRSHAADWHVERSIASAEAWIMIAHIRLITRRQQRVDVD